MFSFAMRNCQNEMTLLDCQSIFTYTVWVHGGKERQLQGFGGAVTIDLKLLVESDGHDTFCKSSRDFCKYNIISYYCDTNDSLLSYLRVQRTPDHCCDLFNNIVGY